MNYKSSFLKLAILSAAVLSGLGIMATRQSGAYDVKKTDMETEKYTQDPEVEIKTTMGDIVVRLYNDTPLHRDNFLKLVEDGFYDGLLFHRVIDKFMVQGGDPDSKDARPGEHLGSGNPGYTVAAEIDYPKHYHKYGALAAARTGGPSNPEMRSSGSQFYIVTGDVVNPQMISQLEQMPVMRKRQELFGKYASEYQDSIRAMQAAGDREGLDALQKKLVEKVEAEVPMEAMPENIKNDYTTIGGTPHLDGQYTVFGEVVKGMDVVEKIQKVETDRSDRPLEDVRILSAKVIKK